MTWIVIGVVLLAAFGPIFWLVPSKKDRRLARLRQEARHAGLVVEIKSIPKLDASAEERVSAGGVVREPKVLCASYAFTLPRKLEHLPVWLALRSPAATDGPWSGWTFQRRPDAANPHRVAMLERFEPFLARLDASHLGIEVADRELRIYWAETPNATLTVPELAAALEDLGGRLTALDAEIDKRIRDEDS